MANNISMRRSTKGPKRRSERNILTFYEKIAVIRYYDETNMSRNSLAKMFHCCATQIRRILERKEELLQQLSSLSEADASIIIEEMTRKRRKFEMCAISFILHQWVERCRQMRLCKTITNQTLKDTALKMAAILNLPTFRPSYRWLNRFRGKYKYTEQDLGSNGLDSIPGELSVEDIIIEFKDSLPSFMQKEISVITSSTKVDEMVTQIDTTNVNESSSSLPKNENSKDFDTSEEDDDADENDSLSEKYTNECNGNEIIKYDNALNGSAKINGNEAGTGTGTGSENGNGDGDGNGNLNGTSAGTTALLNSVFPHLAVIHQFALLNSDVKALELISQLGVHMQSQAAEGAYKQMSLETTGENHGGDNNTDELDDHYVADLDDIVLIE